MCPSLIEIRSKTAEKNSAQTNKQTDSHYENNGHLAVNQFIHTTVPNSHMPGIATALPNYSLKMTDAYSNQLDYGHYIITDSLPICAASVGPEYHAMSG